MPNLGALEQQAHRKTVESSFGDVASFLQEVLGQKLVAYIAGVKDPRTVGRWIAGDREPRPTAEANVRFAYQIFQLLLAEEAPQTVRAWFLGLNPQLGDDSPVESIKTAHFREVMGAARAFLAGG